MKIGEIIIKIRDENAKKFLLLEKFILPLQDLFPNMMLLIETKNSIHIFDSVSDIDNFQGDMLDFEYVFDNVHSRR